MGLEAGEGKEMPELELGLQDPHPLQIYPGFHQHLVVWLPYPCPWSPPPRLWEPEGGPPPRYCHRQLCLLQSPGLPPPPGGIPAEESAQQHELGGGLG